ncbi:methylphosphotriester-DNA--protein-cysteine methyltransferase family protein [Tumebacillus sp. ITR2]|uniref:Methylphosphotriester-DNA--protein-cysteine methyltransferase family protein n=1 Tax=Tumebacillus amylolyticus TaxID=2801339 RepID=A0ABS1JC66_9BACL|nr:bifunctional transcriptional activator/DNA repair enzyme AdaA [Tumebacillus amylolyticus]MBL0387223.1 methylphosphotriester-DNA--protein-cysteine methyltransferase family protein [Tumebacillus amylolyticus]
MEERQWQAIEACDSGSDGEFYYGVRTTGVYCRPSCKSRTPKRENVRVFGTTDEAVNQGFRPCKRCRPEELAWRGAGEEVVALVKGLMQARFAEALSLELLAEEVKMSPHHVHRVFKRETGQTPGEFLLEVRMRAAKELLRTTEWSVTEVAGQVGFVNLSHFSTVFHEQTGQTPTQYRGGAGER